MAVTVRWNGSTVVEEATEEPGEGMTIGAYCKAFADAHGIDAAQNPRFTIDGEPLNTRADVSALDDVAVFLTVDVPELDSTDTNDDKEPPVDDAKAAKKAAAATKRKERAAAKKAKAEAEQAAKKAAADLHEAQRAGNPADVDKAKIADKTTAHDLADAQRAEASANDDIV